MLTGGPYVCCCPCFPCLYALIAHLSMWSFCAKSCQSLPLALAVSKVAQIRCRMDGGILKALDPVWEVTVQSDCVKNGTVSFSLWRNKALRRQIRGHYYKRVVDIARISIRAVKVNPLTRAIHLICLISFKAIIFNVDLYKSTLKWFNFVLGETNRTSRADWNQSKRSHVQQ